MQHFTRLEVWKKAHRLSLEIYRITRRFLRAELYGLTGQLRTELECHLLLARDLCLLSTDDSDELERRTHEVQRMLASLARRLERHKERPTANSQRLRANG